MFIECETHSRPYGNRRQTFWWRIKSRNGQIWTPAETYASKSNCKRAANDFAKSMAELHGCLKPMLKIKYSW